MCMCWEYNCKHKSGYKMPRKVKKDEVTPPKKEKQLDEFRINIGKRMVSARKMAGLSLEEAAKLFGFTKQALNRYELGRIEIDSSVLIKFANAYKLQVDYFMRKPVVLEFGEIKWHKLKRF